MENLGKECKSCLKGIFLPCFNSCNRQSFYLHSADFGTKLSELLNLALNKFLSLVFKFGRCLAESVHPQMQSWIQHWPKNFVVSSFVDAVVTLLLSFLILLLSFLLDFFCERCCRWLWKKWNVLSSFCDLLLLFISFLRECFFLLLLFTCYHRCCCLWWWT